MMIRIGLTGGIAAGKSTVAARLRELGAAHIDYDAIAHRITAHGGAALPAIARAFGPEALNADGSLNRAWMAEHVFGAGAAPDARERLDAIEHPLIYDEARWDEANAVAGAERNAEEADKGRPLVVVHDVPLLAEVMETLPFDFDHVVTVEAPEDVRVARMEGSRGMTRQEALDRIRHQSSREEREEIADEVIDSTQPLEQMFAQVDRLYASWINECVREA
ncbi:dephospho-CoA kinase [Bifidobacterium vespertilionis]|uniref:dephospho-CoA kinase n=1 Tax=Bifidobacterium vespertilionis TaxID=2562524 RepID=UPI001BDCD7D2|nr:dephospho-CoA kinase [Bifidobacterium vespertilionis]MBT1178324.1 dephospho-CoA kinase [Bifidobacterium vespertilionis]